MLYTSLYNYNQEEFFICKIILLVIIIANSVSRILAISSHFRRCLSTSPTSAVMPVYVDFEHLCQYISCSHDQTRLARITRLVKLQNSHSLLCLVVVIMRRSLLINKGEFVVPVNNRLRLAAIAIASHKHSQQAELPTNFNDKRFSHRII